MKVKKLVLFLFLIISISSAYGYKVTPATKTVTIANGRTENFTISLIGSQEGVTERIKVYSTDLSMDRKGSLIFERKPSDYSAFEWIKIGESNYSLFGREKKDIEVSISVPYNAKPGEYYASIMTEPIGSQFTRNKENVFEIERKSRIAFTILIIVPGRKYEKKGYVEDSILVEPSINQVKIYSTFQSESMVQLIVSGEAVIRDSKGVIFGKIPLEPLGAKADEGKAILFPNIAREFEGVLERPLPTGEYKVDVFYHYGYDFKLAKASKSFSVNRKIPIDETTAKFILLDKNEIKVFMPEGRTGNQIVKITNNDYRPLSIKIMTANDWITFNPKVVSLEPGQIKNIMMILSAPKYEEKDEQKAIIIFEPDRGLSSEMKITAIKNKEIEEVKK